MKFCYPLIIVFSLTVSCINGEGDNRLLDTELEAKIVQQQDYALNEIKKADPSQRRIFPRTLEEDGSIVRVSKRDWTSGFYPGILWLMYDLTKNEKWASEARVYTELLESEQFNDSNHDIGFKMMSSFGQGYRLTGDERYREILIQSARTLISRFNENVGCIRSWDHHEDKWDYPVIIDNMVNLELLFWASKETGDPVYANIAVEHAKTTMENHFRSDYSTYHVVSYDTVTGEAVKKQTRQGAFDESCWARGQAWGLYGYTMAYRETKLSEFLNQAENIANYILNIEKLPEDYVPYWDFSLSDKPSEPRDVSAAAIIASALYELNKYSKENKEKYVQIADNIMASLKSAKYFNNTGTNGGFLLRHSTGSKPVNSEIDVPLIYADYYYLEALLRKNQIQSNYLLTAN
ncbi:MAG TPA: glycoside hydrolase family 88 protein [Bacteroidales bacterium]|nr:glycoside hydrolase family 88 protein [Bacteroidales bacterium]